MSVESTSASSSVISGWSIASSRLSSKGRERRNFNGSTGNEGVIGRYSRRWGIENSYKTIKDFLAWTTSKDFSVRVFYFGFAVLLYNMWLLVDLLVQVSLDIEHRYKPRVTAKRFLNLVHKQLAGIDWGTRRSGVSPFCSANYSLFSYRSRLRMPARIM